jgi:hypothetical protein
VFETPFGESGQFAAEVDRNSFSFATIAAGSRYIARPVQSGGWFVESVTIDGKDVTDRAFDLQTDTSVIVTFTDKPSKVTGTVTDERGAAAGSAVVLAFSVHRERWVGYGSSSRLLQSALTTAAGIYTFEHLPPGDYHVVAVDPSELDGWRDPARLEALARDARRVSVASGDSLKTIDLRMRAAR